MSKKKKKDRNVKGKVLKVFKENPSKIFNYKQIASKLEITDTQGRNAVIRSLGELNAQKMINQKKRGSYVLVVRENDYVEGVIEITSSGNAYLILEEEEEDIFIPRKNTNRALDGDRALVHRVKKRKNGKQEGEVVEITQRTKKDHVGSLDKKKDFAFVSTRGSRMQTDFFIEKKEIEHYENGDKVVVRFKDWPKKASSPFGTLIRSLGKPGALNT